MKNVNHGSAEYVPMFSDVSPIKNPISKIPKGKKSSLVLRQKTFADITQSAEKESRM